MAKPRQDLCQEPAERFSFGLRAQPPTDRTTAACMQGRRSCLTFGQCRLARFENSADPTVRQEIFDRLPMRHLTHECVTRIIRIARLCQPRAKKQGWPRGCAERTHGTKVTHGDASAGSRKFAKGPGKSSENSRHFRSGSVCAPGKAARPALRSYPTIADLP